MLVELVISGGGSQFESPVCQRPDDNRYSDTSGRGT